MRTPITKSIAIPLLAAGWLAACSGGTPPNEGEDAVDEAVKELHAARDELRKASKELRDAADALNAQAERSGESRHSPPTRPLSSGSSSTTIDDEVLERGIERVGEHSFELDRAAVDESLKKPGALARSVRVVPARKGDRNKGFKLYAIRPDSLFDRLGLANGDTVTAVNEHELTTADRAIEIYETIKGLDEITVSVVRRGNPLEFTYTIRDD